MNYLVSLAALCGGLSVALGAFAAHGLKAKLPENLLAVFQTGVQYQFYHSLGMLLLVILYRQFGQPLLLWSYGFMFAGILCFSGSLYALALTQHKFFGPITPLGGVFFIVAWGLLCVAGFKMGNA